MREWKNVNRTKWGEEWSVSANPLKEMAPQVGLEPTTLRLTD